MVPDLLAIAVLLLGVGIGVFVVVRWALGDHERRQRRRVLASAMRGGRLDPALRAELVQEFLGDDAGRIRRARRGGGFARFAFLVGWLIVIVALGLLATGAPDATQAGTFCVVLGLGIVALPTVLREYDERILRS